VKTFIVHHQTKWHQAHAFLLEKEKCPDENSKKIILHFDFSENYVCVYQEGAQSTYWCQKPVTLFTVALYKKTGTEIACIVTDKNDHTKVSITVFLEKLFSVSCIHLSFFIT
jgi:hypothetical protein